MIIERGNSVIRQVVLYVKKPVAVEPRPEAWTDQEEHTLFYAWLQGMTASEIAAQIPTRSRNAVLGKVHRLNLPSRPSPIKRVA